MLLKNFLSVAAIFGTVLASPTPQAPATPVIAPAAAPAAAGAPVSKALGDITAALAGLKTKVGVWNGDVVEAANVLLDAEALLDVIKASSKTVSALSMLPLNEAVTVLSPANKLIKEAQATIDALIQKKPAMDKAGLTTVVKGTLVNFKTEAATLITAIIKILPDNVKTVGDSIGKQINATLDKGVAAYS
jgi:hypothetical protein